MEQLEPIWSFSLGPITIDIVPEIIIQWAIMLVIILLALWTTRDLKIKPGKKQAVVELLYEKLKDVLVANMGEKNIELMPFIGTLFIFLLIMNLMGLTGLPVPTKNFSVTVGMGLITFFIVQYYPIKKYGLKEYFAAYKKPTWIITPINILERIMLPVSLALRLFGNILAATFLVELVYEALHKVSFFAQLVIPVPLHAYFDIFDGAIQTVIFVMLTMINIKITAEHSNPEEEH
ncbi:F0F1 ATP synthase subunit A [Caproiciproducens sp. MSJ-32]|uniref:F0F1 ATP synthase subunit A n=1 Tax=Caproiciproducens sp. MSJ-32 TaxID=2841527 RepID=UPI001C11451D|nr:F0F1 ATP synthase subunit A [Caproiciproducens sp. MSJ-32]MBU5454341.1 F0F1 ATP synthase subunit A [Caproiciproducens sp. MSJ-32]